MEFKQTKSYDVSVVIVLAAILTAIVFLGCAPSPAFSGPPKQSKRCVVLIGATWCKHCMQIETDELPKLALKGVKIADYRDKQQADIHLIHLDRRHERDPRFDWGVESETVPVAVVFEDGKIIEKRCGRIDAATMIDLLGRDDLKSNGPPPTPIDEPEPPAERAPEPPVQKILDVASSEPTISTWDQVLQFIGTDTVKVTIEIPNGRKIPIPSAGASATLPDRLTAHGKIVDGAIQIDFDAPLIKAEGKRFGIRIGTTVPGITVNREQATFHTGLGIPVRWKLESHPFDSPSESEP